MTDIEVFTGYDVDSLLANLGELLRGAGSRRIVLILGVNMARGSTTIEKLSDFARELEADGDA